MESLAFHIRNTMRHLTDKSPAITLLICFNLNVVRPFY